MRTNIESHIHAKISKQSMLKGIQDILEGVVGKKCWDVRFGYGGDLRLDLGKRIAFSGPSGNIQTKGAWRFGTCGTGWMLIAPNKGKLSSTRGETQLRNKVKVIEGSKVSTIRLVRNTLSIAFDNGFVLTVIPNTKDDDFDLPYWELFMPRHKLISFGPKNHWRIVRSNVAVAHRKTKCES